MSINAVGNPSAAQRSQRGGLARSLRSCIFMMLVAFAAAQGHAHNLGDSYLYLQIYESSLTGRFEIALDDLNPALGLSGTNLEITKDTIDDRIGFLQDYYLEHVTISDAQRPLPIDFTSYEILEARGGYVLLSFELGGFDELPDILTFDYSILFDEEPSHRGFLLVEHSWATGTFANENQVSLVFSPSLRRQDFDLRSSGRLRGFLALVRLGAEHMVFGLDHVFFLVALLLQTVVRRDNGTWRALEGFKPALLNVVIIVTAFATAHLVAIALTALGLLHPPEAFVETMIAASTTLAAVNILVPLFRRRIWWIIFGLSLCHGLAFAGALTDLGVVDEYLGLSVFAFNLGVEVGLVIIVAVLFPLLYAMRRLPVYRRVLLPVAAVSMIVMSSAWLVERAFGLDFRMTGRVKALIQRVIP